MTEQDEDVIFNRFKSGPDFTPEELIVLTGHGKQSVRVQVAKHLQCPPQAMKILANDESVAVRVLVAAHEACPSELLTEFARNKDWALRAAVAGNKSASPELLLELNEDNAISVVHDVALNPACPVAVMWDHYHGGNYHVLSYVVENPSCPLPLLLLSCEADDPELQMTAIQAAQVAPPDAWTKGFAEGMRLNLPVEGGSRESTLGDDLLKHGLVQAYQLIQGLELDAKIRPQLAADVPMPTSPSRARMRL
ncbi:TPA: hypothetical protein ACJ51G_001133 [Aeromonas hydrophila subsp. hydrophila]|uniref:hypothetical protein n=1 Tax=Aeromonas caviae TaxID=648 RepID=UPI000FEB9189|nr:hypothetical protein [Aeromonas caviae]RWT81259.1 hypothetical protein DN604_00375 [Aeromonas caviae]